MERWYEKWKANTVHPNLKLNYFGKIDTKEKAYWLGFLFADGCIKRDSRTGAMEIVMKLSQKDEETIEKYCDCLGLNKDKKKHVTEKNGKVSTLIIFACRKMGNDLLTHGLIPRKSKRIEYPKLPRRDLELAFLLGYYDGDGIQHTTAITSGNIRFVEQVKDRFDLGYRIHRRADEEVILGRKTKGTECIMCLGARLFNEMMKNYTQSMPRKRWFPCDPKEKARRAAEAHTPEKIQRRRELQSEWRAITKEEPERLVQEMPLIHIATRYNVTDGAVTRRCDRLGIQKPTRGYWTRVYYEKHRTEKQPKENQPTPLRTEQTNIRPA
ncbi:MAG: hypothetical protein WED04_04100 [Promethearchaeati archaeon SRVP18_Atabeyarchaeia-1]